MPFRALLCLLFLLAPVFRGFAADLSPRPNPAVDSDEDQPPPPFSKPYEYERQAYGYDPDGIEYHENEAEDLQVIFVSSLPFTALASYGLTGLASLAFQGNFGVNGNYFIPFVMGALGGAAAVAGLSVLTNKYPPPAPDKAAEAFQPMPSLVFQADLLTAKF